MSRWREREKVARAQHLLIVQKIFIKMLFFIIVVVLCLDRYISISRPFSALHVANQRYRSRSGFGLVNGGVGGSCALHVANQRYRSRSGFGLENGQHATLSGHPRKGLI